jgi:hypothetical protein
MTTTNQLIKNPLPAFFLIIVGTIGSIWILLSNEFYYIDECAHYLYSRFVIQSLPITVQLWHRPLPQWLFAVPAQFGHTVTMFFALALFLVLLLITWRIAVLHGIKHAEWVILLAGLQPILFDLSYACMTEMPAAFMIALSYFYHLKGKHGWSLTLASVVFLCRTEMYLFAGVMFLFYAWKREWKILPLVLVGPLLWIGSSALISGDIMTFFREWAGFSRIGKFIPGVSVTRYFMHLHSIFGLTQALLFAAGAGFIAARKRSAEFGIIYSTIALTLIIHTLAGAEIFHWSASIGELRYIAVVGPLFGIISVYGFSEILDRMRPAAVQLIFSLIVLGGVVYQCTTVTHPRRWANYDKVVIRLTKEIKQDYPGLTLLSNHPISAYILDVPPAGSKYFAPLTIKNFKKYPECIILWDPFFANSIFSQSRLTKEKMLQDTTIEIVDRYKYWNIEYLVLHKKSSSAELSGIVD